MLKADIIVGGYFGDEGKGKLVGRLGHGYDAVLRVNASTNAGHCVSDGKSTWVTRQLPSVFFPEQTQLVIGPGALLNPIALAAEARARPDLAQLRGKLKIASTVALVIEPYIDKGRGGVSRLLGSTHQGTGPTAEARAGRHALHLYDLRAAAQASPGARQAVLDKLRRTCEQSLPLRFAARSADNEATYERLLDELINAYRETETLLGPFCVDYNRYLIDQLGKGDKRVLIEGCNGLLLDNWHGAQPHVTSASTNASALACGANLSPLAIDSVLVVIAAYATCLGKRPFPTELTEQAAAHFRANCNEVDPAENKPRRIGWLDVPGLRKALASAQGAKLHMNKLDVLSGLETIRICTHYRIDDKAVQLLPDDPARVAQATAEYEDHPGWSETLTDVRSFEKLPEKARAFVLRVQDLLGFPIASVGVGPANDDFLEVAV